MQGGWREQPEGAPHHAPRGVAWGDVGWVEGLSQPVFVGRPGVWWCASGKWMAYPKFATYYYD
jgi:hypothetical protein